VYHTSRGIQGFDHPDLPALRITLNVMNATESYLWACPLDRKTIHSHLIDVILAIYSRFRIGLRGVHLQRYRGGFVNLLALPSMFLARNLSQGLTELFNRVRVISLLTSKPQKLCGGSLMDP